MKRSAWPINGSPGTTPSIRPPAIQIQASTSVSRATQSAHHSNGIAQRMLASQLATQRGCRWPTTTKTSMSSNRWKIRAVIWKCFWHCKNSGKRKPCNMVHWSMACSPIRCSLSWGKQNRANCFLLQIYAIIISSIALDRLLNEETKYITVVNMGPYTETVNLKQLHPLVPDKLQYEIVSSNSAHKPGWVHHIGVFFFVCLWETVFALFVSITLFLCSDGVFSKSVILLPKEAFVLRSFNGPSKDRFALDYYLNIQLDSVERERVNDYNYNSKYSDLWRQQF